MQNMRVCLWVWLSWIAHMLTAIRLIHLPLLKKCLRLLSLPLLLHSSLFFLPFSFPSPSYHSTLVRFSASAPSACLYPLHFHRTQLGANFLAIPLQRSWPVVRFFCACMNSNYLYVYVTRCKQTATCFFAWRVLSQGAFCVFATTFAFTHEAILSYIMQRAYTL